LSSFASKPGDHPLPTSELNLRKPIITRHAGPFFRIYRKVHKSPMFFGKTLNYRFDSASGDCGVLYASPLLEGAFVETFLQELGRATVTKAELRERPVALIRSRRHLLFPSRHELNLPSCAIFETAKHELDWVRQGTLDEPQFAAALKRLLKLGNVGYIN
jgi:hypothetical protein